MPGGLYDNPILIPFQQGTTLAGAVSAATLFPVFIAPCDLEIVGLEMHVGTVPGTDATHGFTVNVSDYPTSQLLTSIGAAIAGAAAGAVSAAYNLWTATNVPTIANAATSYPTVGATIPTLIENTPYALNYPLPGPSGTVGYKTAQSTSTTTETPVTAPPTMSQFQMAAFVAPDSTYVDYNGFTVPTAIVHAGDALSFVITALTGGVGAATGLSGVLYAQKR